MIVLAFCVGMVVGALIVAVTLWRCDAVLVDRYWMENADRWEWLRQHELGSTDDQKGPVSPDAP